MAHGDVAPGASPSKPESHSERVQLLPFSHLEMQSPRLPRSYLPARSPWPAPSFHPPRRPDSRPQNPGGLSALLSRRPHTRVRITYTRTRMHAPHVGHTRAYHVHTGVWARAPCIYTQAHTSPHAFRCMYTRVRAHIGAHSCTLPAWAWAHGPTHTHVHAHTYTSCTHVCTHKHRAVSRGFPR